MDSNCAVCVRQADAAGGEGGLGGAVYGGQDVRGESRGDVERAPHPARERLPRGPVRPAEHHDETRTSPPTRIKTIAKHCDMLVSRAGQSTELMYLSKSTSNS